jgi:hypothetical protein
MLGPFKVLNKLSETFYEVECDKKGKRYFSRFKTPNL